MRTFLWASLKMLLFSKRLLFLEGELTTLKQYAVLVSLASIMIVKKSKKKKKSGIDSCRKPWFLSPLKGHQLILTEIIC